MEEISTQTMEQVNPSQDFIFDIVHQDSYSRGQLLLRTFFGFFYIMIPHAFLLWFMTIASLFLGFIAWWAVLFTTKYPKSFFDFQLGLLKWSTRVSARMLNLVDGYPSFGLSGIDDRTNVHVAYPETLSRGTLLLRAFFGFIYVYIPHGICLLFRFIGLYFVVLIAWWAILIVGKYPKVMHNYVVGTFRWIMRLNIYMKFMTDKYPPFSGK
jgi:hypothetical protein